MCGFMHGFPFLSSDAERMREKQQKKQQEQPDKPKSQAAR